MKLLSNGKTLIVVPGSRTGTYKITQGLRYDFLREDHMSQDATEFLPTGSSVGESSPNGFIYSMDRLTMRDDH
jgi:hypothetical protein